MTTGQRIGIQSALCWPYGGTVGNAEAMSPQLLSLLPLFPDADGGDAVLPCDLVRAGLYRHGAPRWWCRTHQTYAGTKADMQALERSGAMRCAAHARPGFDTPATSLNLDQLRDCDFRAWASTPAIVWTAARPQKYGIRVQVERRGRRIIDEVFGDVAHEGQRLDRRALLLSMAARSLI